MRIQLMTIGLILTLGGSLFGEQPKAKPEEPSQIHVKVKGLACPFCVYGVEKKLKKLDGVEKVEVDLGEGLATLDLERGAEVSDKEIQRALKDAGFKASHIHRGNDVPKEQGGLD